MGFLGSGNLICLFCGGESLQTQAWIYDTQKVLVKENVVIFEMLTFQFLLFSFIFQNCVVPQINLFLSFISQSVKEYSGIRLIAQPVLLLSLISIKTLSSLKAATLIPLLSTDVSNRQLFH